VACTITGYQPDGKEIRIRERTARSGWAQKEYLLPDPDSGLKPEVDLSDAIDMYHPCYGAMFGVVVAPHAGDKVRFEGYPYRELSRLAWTRFPGQTI